MAHSFHHVSVRELLCNRAGPGNIEMALHVELVYQLSPLAQSQQEWQRNAEEVPKMHRKHLMTLLPKTLSDIGWTVYRWCEAKDAQMAMSVTYKSAHVAIQY